MIPPVKIFLIYQWNWAWALYAGRGTTDQQRHCCIHCCRLLTSSRCEDPSRCFGCSNALPQDTKHFPGLQQPLFDGWILFGTFISQTAWRPGQEANGATVNVVRCYLWHHYLPPEKQIKSFACLWRCNWLWHGLILWLDRKSWRPDTHELHSLQWRWLF